MINPIVVHRKYWVERIPVGVIAEERGYTKSGFYKWMERNGIPRRPTGEARQRERSSNWNGGYTKTHGYTRILMPAHPRANSQGYVYEHILVVEKELGRPLKPKEVCHHRNGSKSDNYWENLFVFESTSVHSRFEQFLRRDVC